MITIAQFLCCMNGGKLIQDMHGHAIWGTHQITNGEMVYEITSTHHQMQFPFVLNKKDYDILYWSNLASCFRADKTTPLNLFEKDVEICHYHKNGLPQCLAIQGHPEIMRKEAPVVQMINDLIDKIYSHVRI